VPGGGRRPPSPNVLVNDYYMIKLCDFGMARTKQHTLIQTKMMGACAGVGTRPLPGPPVPSPPIRARRPNAPHTRDPLESHSGLLIPFIQLQSLFRDGQTGPKR